MKKAFTQEIAIPSGISAQIHGSKVTIQGPKGSVSKEFKVHKFTLVHEKDKLIVSCPAVTKTEKKQMNTIIAHLANMIQGVQEPFVYELKVCFSHFPITVDLKGSDVTIKNFLGEKIARKATLPQGVEVKIQKEHITIQSPNIELAGQAAANLERATKIRNRDRRVFQDGIFITKKPGSDK